jgi:hypothetical protein
MKARLAPADPLHEMGPVPRTFARWPAAAMLALAAVVSTVVPMPLAALTRLLQRRDRQEQVAPSSE